MRNFATPPYRIKMVEPIRLLSRPEREMHLKKAFNNLFLLPSEAVYIDLLTDSGTGAMSHFQWAALMQGDEAYAGSRSFYRLEQTVKDITDYKYVIPVHQGRGAEQVLLPILVKHPGMFFISNMHFDTTRAHVELAGARALDCVIHECHDVQSYHPFKGNMDLRTCRSLIEEHKAENIAGIIMTVTNNSAGGQPVSLENLKQVSNLAKEFGIPLIMDGARFAENAAFIKMREEAYAEFSIREIARKMFDLCDIFLMSAKKDGLVNIGGLLVIRDNEELFQSSRVRTVAYEGFPTYGGLAGRDLEAMAVGLEESLEIDYLEHRLDQVRYLAEPLRKAGIPLQYPPGGHAVFIDCKEICAHIPYNRFPAQSFCNALYLESGVRTVEVGSLLLGRDPQSGENLESPFEWVRLSIPRRTYTYAHLDFVAEAVLAVYEKRHSLRGLCFEYEPPVLRHFTAKLKYV
ncbi:MAG: tryptophanase [Candidatus Marinimicrobia bacterium]|jgi:tryptophanase|nr:tryptophanase [Candidatus Neomarinimicrobiota bacterium]MDX9777796.1 tryptophanase [bacterium]